MKRLGKRWFVIPSVASLLAGIIISIIGPGTASATTICDKWGTTTIAGGKYIVMNNEWGDNIGQCIDVSATGFAITSGNHSVSTSGAPAGYPAVYAGCHYGKCSSNSGLPVQVSKMGALHSTAEYTTTPSGAYDAAYDIWYDTAPNPSEQNNGAELMIWGSHLGTIQPAGEKVATATVAGATWDVWYTNTGWNVISYVRQQTTNSLDVNIADFTQDSINRGYIQPAWYLTSVQFGFEPWIGGPGLAVNNFTVGQPGGTPTTTPPATTTPATTTTAPPSTTAPATTTPPATGISCSASGTVTGSWQGGFNGQVSITNTGTSAINNWTASWTQAQGVSITNGWNATVTQNGTGVTATAPSWQTSLAPNATASIGFTANGPAGGATGVKVNGVPCAMSATPTTTATPPTTTAAPTTTVAPTTTTAPTTTVAPTTTTPPATTSTTPTPSGVSCKVTTKITDKWDSGFNTDVTVTNTGGAINNWVATWTAPAGTTVTDGWNATVTQSGTSVTATAPSWQTSLAPNASATIGFTAKGTAGPVTGVKVNGVACQ